MELAPNRHTNHLKAIGADQIAHRNGTLLEHLQGVWSLLRQWNNPEAVCLAGLYHSVYSTGGFEQQLIVLDKRHEITGLIGAKAEQMVYLFGACDRPLTHPRIGVDSPMLFRDRFVEKDYAIEPAQWRALCEMMLANEIDLGQHAPSFYKKHLAHYTDLFSRFEPWLSSEAIAAHRQLAASLASES